MCQTAMVYLSLLWENKGVSVVMMIFIDALDSQSYHRYREVDPGPGGSSRKRDCRRYRRTASNPINAITQTQIGSFSSPLLSSPLLTPNLPYPRVFSSFHPIYPEQKTNVPLSPYFPPSFLPQISAPNTARERGRRRREERGVGGTGELDEGVRRLGDFGRSG